MRKIGKIILLYLFCAKVVVSHAENVEPSFLSALSVRNEDEDSLGIAISQNSTYLMPGQMFELSIFPRCNTPYWIKNISIGGKDYEWKTDGVLNYSFPVAAVGNHEIPINVQFVNAKGRTKHKTYIVAFTVGQANASISLDKMNVLYIGIDNPISVAATGGGDEKITVTITGGGGLLAKVGLGRYIVRVKTLTDDCRIIISVDGKIAGMSQFRVRQIPVPVGTIGGNLSGDSITRKAFIAQKGITAYLKDFPFDIHYQVTGFSLLIQKDDGLFESVNCQGALFSPEAKKVMETSLVPGAMVTIGNLFVKGPDGRQIKLLPLVYYIKQ